jgi:hypothetical protein
LLPMSAEPIKAFAAASFLLLVNWTTPVAVAQTAPQNQYLPLSNYLPALDVAPPRLLRIEPDGPKNTSDYFAQVMLGTTNRIFKFNAMPIPVYIQPNQPGYVSACNKALETWEIRTNSMIKFAPVGSQPQARISIIWSHLGMPADPSSTEFGAHTITEWKVKTGGMFPGNTQRTGTVTPQIVEVNLDVIEARKPEQQLPLLQNLITHELGHAIGIIGHSPERGDMMYTETDEFSRISQRDLNTLQKIYSRKCDFPL